MKGYAELVEDEGGGGDLVNEPQPCTKPSSRHQSQPVPESNPHEEGANRKTRY